MATTNINSSSISKTGSSPSSTPVSTGSDEIARTQQAASVAFTTVNRVPSTGQQQAKTEEKDVTQIPTVLVNGAVVQPADDDVEEAFFECEIPDDMDVEEAFFDPNNLIQESEHAQDIVKVLLPCVKKSWDADHVEGSFDSMFLTAYMTVSMEYSAHENPSISANSDDLAWIAISKLVAKEAGLPPELYCPQFPWENTAEEGVANTEQLERWEAIKTYLEEVQNVEKTEEGSEPQPQTSLSHIRDGLSTLATTVASNRVGRLILLGGAIWALSSLPVAAAAATAAPVLGSATNGVCGVCIPYAGICLNGAVNAATGTLVSLASGTLANISSAASAVPYIAAAASPVVASILGSSAANAMNFSNTSLPSILGSGAANALNFSNTSLPSCPVGAAPSIAATATSGSWLGYLGYLPPLVNAGSALLEGNYLRAAAHVAGGAVVSLAATYYGVPGAITAGVLTAAAGRYLPTAPVDAASVVPAHTGFYERKNVVCKKGVFNIKVPGPEGLSPEQQEDLINAFIAEVLDQNPVKTRVGDIVEFEFPDSKSWTAHVTPKDGGAAGRTLVGEKTYSDSPSHRNSIKKLETLRAVMGKGAKVFAVMTALRSITMDSIPSNAPIVVPVAFANARPSLCSAMQAMLAIPEIRNAMKGSHHTEINRVANAYEAKLGPGHENDPLDLAALERALNPDSQLLDILGYQKALLDLMGIHGDDLSKVLVPKLAIDSTMSLSKDSVDKNWEKAREAPVFPKFKISPVLGEERLQSFVDDNLAHGGIHTRFDSVPNFLQVSVEAAGTNPAAKLTGKLELDLDWLYIHPEKRKAAPKPNYGLQNIILHTAAGQATYQKTVEKVNGETKNFYWKCDPAIENGAPVCIDEDEFQKAANSEAKKDLFFSKQEKTGVVQKVEILGERYDTDSNPDLGEANNVSIKYNNMVLPTMSTIEWAVSQNDPGNLERQVKQALNIAYNAGHTEITLPVPVGDEAHGMNWPIGVMWYAAQEFRKGLAPGRDFKVNLAIDKSKKRGERRAHLVQQIDKADEIYQNNPNFAAFTKVWDAYCKPKPVRHAFSFY